MPHTVYIKTESHLIVITSDAKKLHDVKKELNAAALKNNDIGLLLSRIQESIRTLDSHSFFEVSIVKPDDTKPLLLDFNQEGNLEHAEELTSGKPFQCECQNEKEIISAIDEFICDNIIKEEDRYNEISKMLEYSI